MHPLDMLKNRKKKAQEEHGLGMCNITKCCTEDELNIYKYYSNIKMSKFFKCT